MNTIYHMPMPRSFADVEAWMAQKMDRKVAHNTRCVEYVGGEHSFSITYHGNEIIRFCKNRVLVKHCGWPTSTTADRFHHLTPFSARYTYNYGGERSGWGRAKERYDCKILVAGIELPDDGSAIAFTWEGKLINDSATA